MVTIERIITHGAFELDGGSWEVDNNIGLVGDDSDVVVFDAAHDAAPILAAVNGPNVVAMVCTHGHNDHVTVTPELDPGTDFRAVSDEDTLRVAGTELQALHTPRHSPGSVCRYAPELSAVFMARGH
ncbi:hypothetical protein AWC15_04255 [Mycobacterium lacus]|uniref:Metallo-beta-lactamase domain-containing protein n=1 Tax=Mycobacterium lacus TaxID=169765 RepID=A0A1X1XY24_9MYCO|nr:hypothetical protein AWC15_04255 [Mycobacterium lacus]BBX96978.1 hypothetical protein MLAC_22720 [Mycobacterium lacus]